MDRRQPLRDAHEPGGITQVIPRLFSASSRPRGAADHVGPRVPADQLPAVICSRSAAAPIVPALTFAPKDA